MIREGSVPRPADGTPRRGRARPGGFTLVELLLVLAILGILSGVLLGYLRGLGGGEAGAAGVIRARLSAARNTAAVTNSPSWVRFFRDPSVRADALLLQWTSVTPVFFFSFEEGARGPGGWNAELVGGKIVPEGRFGNGLVQEKAGVPGLLLPTEGRDDLRLQGGFSLRADLKPSERRTMIVVKWGKTFSLGVDETGRPQASLTLRGVGDLPGKTVVLGGATPLTPDRWTTLELLADGRGAWLLVDGEAVDRARAAGKPYFRLGEPLFLSAPQAPVAGVVDEVRLQALEAEAPEALPEGVDVKGPDLVRFMPGGALDPSLHPDGVELQILLPGGGTRTILVTPAGVVQ